MANNGQLAIEPLEDFISAGLQAKFQQVFGCPVIITTATDKIRSLDRFFEGKQIKYPYAFLMPGAITANLESYNPHTLGRRGLLAIVKDGFAYSVKILPANMEYDIEYVTDTYSMNSQVGSALAFIRRWFFARRFGYMRFSIKYGRLALAINTIMGDSPTVPPRENVVENESAYRVAGQITVKGYISEPVVSTVGIIQDVEIDGQVMNADGSFPGGQFFSFEDLIATTEP